MLGIMMNVKKLTSEGEINMSMRGIETQITKIRQMVFTGVAKIAYESTDVKNDIEELPYQIVTEEEPKYRDSIYRERAVVSERIRLAMGMSLRPEDKPVHITANLDESNIADKYYEPPLMQVIPSACEACDDNVYEVSNQCRGCVAHPCTEVCPVNAISMVNGKSFIDKAKCIKCGKCKAACPYDAIAKRVRPCAQACGVNAITSDSMGRAFIQNDKCVSCGQCMISCTFGAIADKSQFFQLIRAMQEGDEVIAIIAPAFVGQFGPNMTQKKVKAALMDIGFSEVYEVALGADMGAVAEAHHYVNEVTTGKVPFLFTSCCPSWSVLARNTLPDLADNVSEALTPMVATARSVKQKHKNSRIVFVGPCAAKKLEASRRAVRSDVDFVITFEELMAMFTAKNIDLTTYDKEVSMHDATGAGRGYAVAGGVSKAIEDCINEYYPGTEVKIHHVEGLAECKKTLLLAKAGKMDGYLIEGMGCPGGCVAGAGTCLAIPKASQEVKKFVKSSTENIPSKELEKIDLP